MWIKDDEFFARIEAAKTKLSKMNSPTDITRRLAHSLNLPLLHGCKDIESYCDYWRKQASTGSSSVLIANFIGEALLSPDVYVFQHGLLAAQDAFDRAYVNQALEPFGLELAFTIIACMEQSRNPMENLRNASEVLSMIAKHNTNKGFRCFATFLEAFVGPVV